MAPQQRTFTIVPNPLGMQGLAQRPAGEGPPSHRPMTSKQAQKLHRQATRPPKRTKAEQAEWEAEQKRLIKEEDEKRRASNKARILREKKKEREQKIIEAKKRKGLPVVDVRPSQGLITRFVRGNGSGKKRDVAGAALVALREESPACDSATETAADEDVYSPAGDTVEGDRVAEAPMGSAALPANPCKRSRTDTVVAGQPSNPAIQGPIRSQRASRTAVSALQMLDARSRESSLDVDDPVVDALLTAQIPDDSVSAANSSAILQEPPVRGDKTASHIAPGKENIPPPLRASVTSAHDAVSSPPKAALSQSYTQPTLGITVVAKETLADRRQIADVRLSQRPQTSLPRIRQLPQQQSQALSPRYSKPSKSTVLDVRRSSPYDSDLFDAVKSVSPSGTKTSAGQTNHVRQHPLPSSSQPLGRTTVASGSQAPCDTGNSCLKSSSQGVPLPGPMVNSHRRIVNASKVPIIPPPSVSTALQSPRTTASQAIMQPPPPPSNRSKRPCGTTSPSNAIPRNSRTAVPHQPTTRTSRDIWVVGNAAAESSSVPSSTQLFVLSHLDDILPSPSQELRELEKTAPPRPIVAKSRPPLWKPPPGFSAPGVRPAHRPAPTPPPQFKAAHSRHRTSTLPPAPSIQQSSEPAFPFFSTQDFLLSSQDIRDLEDTTETPSKLPGKDPLGQTSQAVTVPSEGRTATAARVQPYGSARAVQHIAVREIPAKCPQFSEAPRYSLRKSQPRTPVYSSSSSARASEPPKPPSQSRCPNSVQSTPSLSHVVGATSQRTVRSSLLSQVSQTDVVGGTCGKSSSARLSGGLQKKPRSSPTVKVTDQPPSASSPRPPRQEPRAAQPGGHKPPPEAETPTASSVSSPQKGRFFTASNEAIQLAVERSMRTHREEQRKREAEERALGIRRREQEEEERYNRERERERAKEANLEPCWDGAGACTLDDGLEDRNALIACEGEQCGKTEDDGGFGERSDGESAKEEEKDLATQSSRMSEGDLAGEAEGRTARQQSQADSPADRNEDLRLVADKRASQDARDASAGELEAFDLESDLEQELLKAEYDMLQVQVELPQPVVVVAGQTDGSSEVEPRPWVASQETDYGDLDVAVEDLDDYL